jgi:hypothetical protein
VSRSDYDGQSRLIGTCVHLIRSQVQWSREEDADEEDAMG